jgi:anti-sigma B factor antagonist
MSSCACLSESQFVSALIKEPKLKLSLEVRESLGMAVVYCKGRLVYRDEAAALSATVSEVSSRVRQVVLDLSGVEAIDSAGVGELVAVLNQANARGNAVRLVAPSPRVYSLLKLFKLTSLFEIHPTLGEAVLAGQQSVLIRA